MARRKTCNELISRQKREKVIALYTQTSRTMHQISNQTEVPIEKIKVIVAGMDRPVPSPKLTDRRCTDLLMGWGRKDRRGLFFGW